MTDHAASGRIHTLAPHGDNTQTQPRQAERRRIGWSGGLIETRPSARSLGERTPSKSHPAVTMNGVCQLRPRDAPLCPPAPRPPCRGKGFAPASTLPVHPGEASAGHAALGAHSVLSSTRRVTCLSHPPKGQRGVSHCSAPFLGPNGAGRALRPWPAVTWEARERQGRGGRLLPGRHSPPQSPRREREEGQPPPQRRLPPPAAFSGARAVLRRPRSRSLPGATSPGARFSGGTAGPGSDWKRRRTPPGTPHSWLPQRARGWSTPPGSVPSRGTPPRGCRTKSGVPRHPGSRSPGSTTF